MSVDVGLSVVTCSRGVENGGGYAFVGAGCYMGKLCTSICCSKKSFKKTRSEKKDKILEQYVNESFFYTETMEEKKM